MNGRGKRKLTQDLIARELGLRRRISVSNQSSNVQFLLHHNLLHCWNQRILDIGHKNKVFASCWLNNDNVIYGTKCNHLTVHDVRKSREYDIPLLHGELGVTSNLEASTSQVTSFWGSTAGRAVSMAGGIDQCQSGIHAITANPSGTMLATGGANVWEIGVYLLPEVKPWAVLCGAHRDWVFDLCWIDDEFVVSCSRDTSLAMWRVNPDSRPLSDRRHKDGHGLDSAVCRANAVLPADRFRAVDYSREYNVLGVLTMTSRVYLYDPTRLSNNKQSHLRLSLNSDIKETVALRRCPSRPELFSVCSQKVVVCLDVRCPSSSSGGFKVNSQHGDCGIRSVNFQGDLLSYGTSQGGILFFDIRARKHMVPSGGELNVGQGWIRPLSEVYLDALSLPAVYTHEYDPTGTRLFAAGGPIAAAYHGNVCCLWE